MGTVLGHLLALGIREVASVLPTSSPASGSLQNKKSSSLFTPAEHQGIPKCLIPGTDQQATRPAGQQHVSLLLFVEETLATSEQLLSHIQLQLRSQTDI